MHDIEAFTEAAVRAVADSGLPVGEKRNLIYSLFILESKGDTGFTNARTLREMVESAYTFLFDKEEMWDYAENRRFYDIDLPRKASFANGDIYPYRDYAGAFPQGDGKLCVDSGSPAWKAMVRAGKIAGEGAVPVIRLPGLETLQTAKYLLVHQNGGMNAALRRGFISTFFLTEAGSQADEGRSADALSEALGPDWDAHLIEAEGAGQTGGRAKVYYFMGTLTPFSVDEEWWGDGSWIFYGYRATLPVTLSLWGAEIPCEVRIQAAGGPVRINPFALDQGPVEWLVHAREVAKELAAFDREMDGQIKAAFSPGVSPVLKQCLNWEKMRGQMAALREISGRRGLRLEEAVTGLADIFAEMASLLEGARIPESALSEGSPLTALLSRLKVIVHGYLELDRRGGGLDLRLAQALGRLGLNLESLLDRHKAVALRRAQPDRAVVSLAIAWQDELAGLEAAPSRESNARRAQLMENLWKSEALFLDDRGIYAAKLSHFYAQASKTIEEKRKEVWAQIGKIPDLSGPLAEMEGQLVRLQNLPLQEALAAAQALCHPESLPEGGRPTCALAFACLGEGGARAQALLDGQGWPRPILLSLEGDDPLEAIQL